MIFAIGSRFGAKETRRCIEIDGSLLEGGGQIRNASALSCLLSIPVRIRKIRLKRQPQGLKQQNLQGLQFLTQLSSGHLFGGYVGSQEILLQPGGGVTEVEFTVDQSAGSVKTVFQSVLPILLFADHETRLILTGMTEERNSPSLDYIRYILLPFLERHFGIQCQMDVRRRCISDGGRGEVCVTITPWKRNVDRMSLIQRGDPRSITGIIWHAKRESSILSAALERSIRDAISETDLNIPLNLFNYSPTPSDSEGLGLLLYVETTEGHRIAASMILEIPLGTEHQNLVEQVKFQGREVVQTLEDQVKSGGILDASLADQIVLFIALSCSDLVNSEKMGRGGTNKRYEIRVGEVSLHLETAMQVAEAMLSDIKFSMEEIEGGGTLMICERKV